MDVVAEVRNKSTSLTDGFTYDASLSAVLSGVSPAQASAAGGAVKTCKSEVFFTFVTEVS